MTASALPAPAPARSALRTIAIGLGIGFVYGVTIRAWMRFVTTSPEFSWSGTSAIVGSFAVLGLSAGIVTAIRHRARPSVVISVRVVAIVLGLACFSAAGAAMFPTIITGALALARPDLPRWLRLVLGGFAFVSAAALMIDALVGLPWPRLVAGVVWYLLLCAVEVALFSRLFAPTLPRGTFPKALRVIATILAVVFLVFAALLTGVFILSD